MKNLKANIRLLNYFERTQPIFDKLGIRRVVTYQMEKARALVKKHKKQVTL